MTRIFIFLLLAFVLPYFALSQSSGAVLASSSGDSFNNSTFQLNWSLGEVTIETYNSETYVLTQGFHQNNYIITSINDFSKNIELSVYPNPTTNYLTLQVDEFKTATLNYTLSDVDGKSLLSAQINNNLEKIDVSRFATGTYILFIKGDNQIIKSFKIIKY